ncbi:LAME_0B02784g1_1 [Lachancea meyersii CBS 8951]|uniref:LAME_0B02784g1_1 n=1 Tax=Lachancea meyersii CBS 8951 TaxID=1266667 RepID=A0A1G4ITS4_9SACH|nr:LAME_0B02784g1_1 [Lachancea meyersii CBS 8951]
MFPIAIENSRHHSLPPLLLPDISRMGAAAAAAAAASTSSSLLLSSSHALFHGSSSSALYGHHVPRLQPLPLPRSHDQARPLPLPPAAGLESLARIAVATETRPVTPDAGYADREVPAPRRRSRSSPRSRMPLYADAASSSVSSVGAGASVDASALPAAAASGAPAAALRGTKRQRAGPSCDTCRLKKIKCDARIQTLWQHESLVMFNGDRAESLHVIITADEVRDHVLASAQLPTHVKATLQERLARCEPSEELIRHVDKLILFKPCASCVKAARPASRDLENATAAATTSAATSAGCCNFAKGYTRADIAVFTRLCRKLGTRAQLSDFSVSDYREAGY